MGDVAVEGEGDAKMSDVKPEVTTEGNNGQEESAETQKPASEGAAGGAEEDDVDAQLEAMKKRLADVEAQREELKTDDKDGKSVAEGGVATVGGLDGATPGGGGGGGDAVEESDARSVYVGNVDYGATVEELGAHFADCGTINRVTIMCNKATGMPKGFAYIEFADDSSVKHATILDGTEFRKRTIKVTAKRTNVPGMGRGGRRPRYRGGGRGYGRRGRRPFRARWY